MKKKTIFLERHNIEGMMYELNIMHNHRKYHTTQFQIEGGGMVQGVTKLIMTFYTFF